MNAREKPIPPMSSSHSGQPLAAAGSTCSGCDSAPGVGDIENLEACSLLMCLLWQTCSSPPAPCAPGKPPTDGLQRARQSAAATLAAVTGDRRTNLPPVVAAGHAPR